MVVSGCVCMPPAPGKKLQLGVWCFPVGPDCMPAHVRWCSMLQWLGELHIDGEEAMPRDTVMPHQTWPGVNQDRPVWPKDAFPQLQSLQLILIQAKCPASRQHTRMQHGATTSAVHSAR